ncbi:transmembrane protein 231 [Culex quinquefasciatus]|uniref:transmembrane protein 231 n=1 Tax=Culex quinquefasciatus TaxID=7176 RepID=UPI0018E35517|nr:transmembrane protein 231 [Culex quinquefasciatus]
MVTIVDQTNHSQPKSKTMKHLFNLHRKAVRIDYRNQLCSLATFATGCVVLLSLIIPYYVVQFINPGDVWDRYRLAYEQPRVHFDYRYLFLTEVALPEAQSEIITCSSFEPYNELTEQRQECGVIKVTSDDSNVDGKVDALAVSVSFNLPQEATGLKFYTFYFFLDAVVKSRCLFKIPTIISLDKVPPPVHPFPSGTITHSGHLTSSQTVALQCPFFMRNIKSHFNHNYLPGENYTSLHQFLPPSILDEIESSNAAYFKFDPHRSHWTRDGAGEVTIRVELTIGGEDSRRTALLYNTSIWQKVAQFWMQYFSVLVVSLWLADKVKDWLFERFVIRAMEVVPWKEKYN